MSDPRVTIQIEESGAAKTEQAVEKVAQAQEHVAKATTEAAKAAEKAADATSKQAEAVGRLEAAERRRQAAANRLAAAESKRRADAAAASTETRAAAAATESAAAAQRTAAAAAADASAAFGKQSAVLGLVKGAASGAAKALALVARAANILPALGLSGALVLIYKGFVALAQAIGGSSKAAEGWVRISTAAARSTDAYVAAIKDMPYASDAATIAQVRLTQAVERSTRARAEALAEVDAAAADAEFARANERDATAAQKNATTISELAEANERLRAARKRQTEAAAALWFFQLKLTNRSEEYTAATERARKAEQARALASYNLRDSLVSLAGTLSGAGTGGVYGALLTVEQQAKRTFGAIVAAANQEIVKRRAPRRAAAPDGPVKNEFYARQLSDAQRMAALLPKIQQGAIDKRLKAEADAVERERKLEQDRLRLYADGVDARIAATKKERSAQVAAQEAMTNAVAASAQSYASAALSALLYGGSVSEAINATARAAFVEGTVGALGALAKAAVFSIINPPGVAPMLAAAKLYGAQAAVAGAIAAGTGGIAGGGGGGSTAINEPTPADFGEPERRKREDSTIYANFASGQGGRPLSRADARAVIGALVDIAREGGMRGLANA